MAERTEGPRRRTRAPKNVRKKTGFSIFVSMFCIASMKVRSPEAPRPSITEQAKA